MYESNKEVLSEYIIKNSNIMNLINYFLIIYHHTSSMV